jgi:serine protease AprX
MRFIRLLVLASLLALAVAGSPTAQSSVIAPWLDTALRQSRATDRQLVWVYFRDKGPMSAQRAAGTPSVLSARARARRAARAAVTPQMAVEDVQVESAYVQQVASRVGRIRHTSRWLNAVSAEATASQIQAVAALPFVARVDLVRRYRRRSEPIERSDETDRAPRAGGTSRTHAVALNYGTSFEQLAQIRVPELHDRGLNGAGVVVAVFDAGFPNFEHDALATIDIVGEHDFVNNVDAARGTGDNHGLATLSVIGGRADGQLYGPAYGASFILAITEDVRSETPVEEDNWAAAAEWAEAFGADVISSSLGYLDFDLPYTSYTDRDMNGEVAITTKAAGLAAARGVVVVNSAGNGGFSADHNTLGAPADGRKIVSVGAVDVLGMRAEFSSVGPTADGRTKPDVAALGVRVKVASVLGRNIYGRSNGTSFSCPLTAGVVALILQAHPTYTVDQVLTALRSSGNQAANPDNLLGWGIIDAVTAVDVAVPPDMLPTFKDLALR